jgi:hypothetical protein
MHELREATDNLPQANFGLSVSRTKYAIFDFGKPTASVPPLYGCGGVCRNVTTPLNVANAGVLRSLPNPSQEDCMPERISDDWRQTAEAARDEQDPAKFMQLVNQLNRELKKRAGNMALEPNEDPE